MIIRYIFKNGTEYLHAWQNCIDRMIGNKELDREIHSKETALIMILLSRFIRRWWHKRTCLALLLLRLS